MIAQGVDDTFLPPCEENPRLPAVIPAMAGGVPVVLVDRSAFLNVAKPGVGSVTFMGSPLVDEVRRARRSLADNSDRAEIIIELEGTTGSSPAYDWINVLDGLIGTQPDMQIAASQSGDFA